MMKSDARQSVPNGCRHAFADGYLQTNPPAVLGADGGLPDYQEAEEIGTYIRSRLPELVMPCGAKLWRRHVSQVIHVQALHDLASTARSRYRQRSPHSFGVAYD